MKAQTPTVSGTSSLTDGDTTTLTCSSASSPLSGASYEWYADGIAVSGASSSTYTTPVVSMSDDGKVYTCKVVFNAVTSDISSTSVTLTGEYEWLVLGRVFLYMGLIARTKMWYSSSVGFSVLGTVPEDVLDSV